MEENRRNSSRHWRTIYLSAKYIVVDPLLLINVEAKNPELDFWLDKINAFSWTFLTAVNPGSKQLSPQENSKRNKYLESFLSDRGYRFYQGKGIDRTGDWPDEPSFLVLNLSRKQAKEIGIKYSQNAILYGKMDAESELIWCR